MQWLDDKRYCSAMSGGYCRVCHNRLNVIGVPKLANHSGLRWRRWLWKELMTSRSIMSLQWLTGQLEGVVLAWLEQILQQGIYCEALCMTWKALQILQRLDEMPYAQIPSVRSSALTCSSSLRRWKVKMDAYANALIVCLDTLRQQAELLSTVKDDKVFENEALKEAQQLASSIELKLKKEWLNKVVKSTCIEYATACT